MLKVRVKKLDPGAKLPTKGTTGSACFDVYALEDTWLPVGSTVAVRTGLAFELPIGFELEVRPRSGLARRESITLRNSPGTLDSDYRGELQVLLVAYEHSYRVRAGDRIAQVKISKVLPVLFVEAEELSVTARGEDGYGSTGR